jgi:photosystem II stability/assembly factor-like uncharacterized protein
LRGVQPGMGRGRSEDFKNDCGFRQNVMVLQQLPSRNSVFQIDLDFSDWIAYLCTLKQDRMKYLLALLCLTFATEAFSQTRWLHDHLPVGGLTKLMSVSAATDSDVVIVADGFGEQIIFRSTDRGSSWAKPFSLEIGGLIDIKDAAHPSKDIIIATIDSPYSWTVGKTTTFTGAGAIMTTIDDGKTWIQKDFGIKGDTINTFNTGIIRMFDADRGVAPVTLKPLQLTTDKGLNWSSINSPSDRMPYVLAMDVVQPSTIVLVTHSWALNTTRTYRSTNLGQTWDSSATAAPRMVDMQMIDPNLGYAISIDWSVSPIANHIMKTTDGGMTWISLYDTTMGGVDPIKCLAFNDAFHGFAFGRDGLIWETTNGGTDWTMEKAEYSPGVDMGAFFDATWKGDLLMAVGGDGGMVIRQATPLLPQPTFLVPSYGNPVEKTFKAYWKKSEGAERYEMRLLTNTWPRQTLISEDNLVDTTYNFTGLNDYSYFLEVRAVSSDNRSNWSKVHFIAQEPAAVQEKPVARKLLLSPNPSIDREVSVVGLTDVVQVSVVDIIGNTLTTAQLDPTSNQLDLRALPAGSYIVTVSTGAQIESLNLILK